MDAEISRWIGKFVPLCKEDLDLFLSKFRKVTRKRGSFYIQEGRPCPGLGFIVKGSTMCLKINNGTERIDGFSLEMEFVTDYTAILTRAHSSMNVRCLEDTTFLVISPQDLQSLYAAGTPFERIGRLVAENLYMEARGIVRVLFPMGVNGERWFLDRNGWLPTGPRI
jgi:hypothetical protein